MRGAVTPMGAPHLRLSELFTQFPSQYERPTYYRYVTDTYRRSIPFAAGCSLRHQPAAAEPGHGIEVSNRKGGLTKHRVEASTEGQWKYNCDHAAHPKFRPAPVAPAKWLRDAQRSLSQLRDTCSCVIPSERAVAKRVRGRNR